MTKWPAGSWVRLAGLGAATALTVMFTGPGCGSTDSGGPRDSGSGSGADVIQNDSGPPGMDATSDSPSDATAPDSPTTTDSGEPNDAPMSADACTGGQTLCGSLQGYCADLQNDPNNCGDCAKKCADGDTCVAGQCEPPADSSSSSSGSSSGGDSGSSGGEGGLDAEVESGTDGSVEAGLEAGPEAGLEAGLEAGPEAGQDSGDDSSGSSSGSGSGSGSGGSSGSGSSSGGPQPCSPSGQFCKVGRSCCSNICNLNASGLSGTCQ